LSAGKELIGEKVALRCISPGIIIAQKDLLAVRSRGNLIGNQGGFRPANQKELQDNYILNTVHKYLPTEQLGPIQYYSLFLIVSLPYLKINEFTLFSTNFRKNTKKIKVPKFVSDKLNKVKYIFYFGVLEKLSKGGGSLILPAIFEK